MRRPARILAASVLLALVGVLSLPAAAMAAPPVTLIAGSPEGAFAAVDYDGLTYVFATDPGTGDDHIWAFDGTTFVDAVPGQTFLNADSPVVYDGEIFFAGYDGVDWMLWHFDGTTAEAVTGVGPQPVDVDDLVVFQLVLYFTADFGGDIVLWGYDSTGSAVVLGTGPTSVSSLAVFGSDLVFVADNGSDFVLFLWTGSAFEEATGSGTVPLNVSGLVVAGGLVVLDGDVGLDHPLVTWDGSAFVVRDTGTPPDAAVLGFGAGVLGSNVIFSGVLGPEIVAFVFDGATVAPLDSPSPAVPSVFATIGSLLYFSALDDLGDPRYYSWDGSTLAELVGVTPVDCGCGPGPGGLVFARGTSVFFAGDGDDGPGVYELPTLPLVPVLAATGIDGMPLLATAVLLALAGAVLVTRRRAA